MHDRRRLLIALTLATLWSGSAIPALAADNGTVDATVTVATPCILVSPTTLDFGTLSFGSSASQGISHTNCGPVNERVYAWGTDATRTSAVWILNPTFSGGANCGNGPSDEYRLNILSNGNANFAPVALSGTDQLVQSVAPGAVGDGDQLYITMPCTGSGGVGETVSFQVNFTATF